MNYYVAELLNNLDLVDKFFVYLFYSRNHHITVDVCGHVCSEELSFFVILFSKNNCESLCTSLFHFLHPNTKKYVTRSIQF